MHATAAAVRRDFLHKATTALVDQHALIAIRIAAADHVLTATRSEVMSEDATDAAADDVSASEFKH